MAVRLRQRNLQPMNNYNNPPLIARAGSYTGNDTANRAIPHNLGRTPVHIFIAQDSSNNSMHLIYDRILYGSAANHVVTPPNGVNFYVGNAANYAQSANGSTIPYHWVAL